MVETSDLVKSLADKYGRNREALIPILQGIIQADRFLSQETMTEVANELNISAAQVYGTATFYSFLDTEPRGTYVIRVCRTITCAMKGKNAIVQTIEELLKIKVGETTQNKKFSLLETNCLGWCHKGPAMLINDEAFTELDPDKVREIISEYIKK